MYIAIYKNKYVLIYIKLYRMKFIKIFNRFR